MKKLIFYLIVLCCLTSCSTYPYLYHWDNSNTLLSHKRIAMPFNIFEQNKFAKNTKIKNQFADSIVLELKRLKFDIVDTAITNNFIDSLVNVSNGLYDTKTGQLDTIKIKNIEKSFFDYINNRFGNTLYMYPYFVVVPAEVNNRAVRWHGRACYNAFLGNLYGRTNALSLYVVIKDSKNNIIFDNAGGIQPLTEFIFGSGFEKIKNDELFKDPHDISKALEIIFKPIKEKLKNGL